MNGQIWRWMMDVFSVGMCMRASSNF
jgi:hypothetical protein